MRFNPKSEEELKSEEQARIDKYKPWPIGTVCDYEVFDATDTETKGKKDEYGEIIEGSKKPMIKAEVRLFNDKGETKEITEYLGLWSEYKIRRIAPERYEAGDVEARDLINKTGKCVLGIQIGGLKDDGVSRYADKNEVKEYLKPIGAVPRSIKAADPELDDELPF